ncbi:MAG: spore coat protein CotJB [Clostridia bacterium]|nr:spore coat protein CotJB [Clostridia bacterium]MBQ5814307.1 spore coat protein CotJB [Clostridia bacterium]
MMNMNDRTSALRRLQAADFALIEANLYLDTHPQCPCGLEYFRCMRNERDDALCSYEMNFGPLTMDNSQAECSWEWINDPWPWEMEA